MSKNRFAEQLLVLRKEVGMTQVELADKLSVSKGTVAMWETGKRETSYSMLISIADFFEVTVHYLLTGKEI